MSFDPCGTLEETLARIESVLSSAISRLGGMDLDAEDLAEIINVDANDGSNDPAGPARSATSYSVLYETRSGFLGEYMPRKSFSEAMSVARSEVESAGGKRATVVSVTREILAEVERCGHA